MEADLMKRTYYKYRSLTDFERFLDIIVNKRFYGAVNKELNDPMEGRYNKIGLDSDDFDNIRKKLGCTRICSLLTKQDSQDFPDDYLMWSHYADSHKGCCIEVEPTGQYNTGWELLEVKYKNTLPLIDAKNLDKGVKDILSVKTPVWKSEHEVRAVKIYDEKNFSSYSPHYHVKVKAVYLGDRITSEKSQFYKKIITSIDPTIQVFKITEDRTNKDFYPSLKAELMK